MPRSIIDLIVATLALNTPNLSVLCVPSMDLSQWESLFEGSVEALQEEVKEDGVACSNDIFFPFPYNLHRARKKWG